MATKMTARRTPTFEAPRPFYAVVGAGDLAIAFARTAATGVQARVARVDLEPRTVRDQAATVVATRVEELQGDAKKAQAALEARIGELQADAKALPAKLEKLVNDYVTELTKGYVELAARGETFVAKVRGQQSTQDTAAAAETTTAKARTTTTQAAKSAKAVKRTTKSTTKKTSSSAKATGTAAKKTAGSAAKATTDAARKAGA
jgi:hypothetical protein